MHNKKTKKSHILPAHEEMNMALPSEIKLKIKELLDIVKESFAATDVDLTDRENSMLRAEQRTVAWELVHRTQAYYQNKMAVLGGVDKVLENLEEYIVQQIDNANCGIANNNSNNNISPGRLAQSDPNYRQDISDTDIGRCHTSLRALLDKSVPDAGEHTFAWPNHLYKGSTAAYNSSQDGAHFSISLRELLAYYWLAASDADMTIAANFADEAKDNAGRQTLIENSKVNFVSNLASIAREHNRDKPEYKFGKDRSSCIDGIFGRITTCSSYYNAVTTSPFDAIPAAIQDFIVEKIVAAGENQAKIFNYIDSKLSLEDTAEPDANFANGFIDSLSTPESLQELLQYLSKHIKGFNSLADLEDLEQARIESCIENMLQIEQVNLHFEGALNTEFLLKILTETQPEVEFLHLKDVNRANFRKHFAVVLTNLAILKDLQKAVDHTLILKTLSQNYAENIFPERNHYYLATAQKCLQDIQAANEQLSKLGFNYQGMTDTLKKLPENQLDAVIKKTAEYFDNKELEVINVDNNNNNYTQANNYQKARTEALSISQYIIDILGNNNPTDFYRKHLWLTTMVATTQASKWANFIISIARAKNASNALCRDVNQNKLNELIKYMKQDTAINFKEIADEIAAFYKKIKTTRELQELNTSESLAIIKDIFYEKLNLVIDTDAHEAEHDFISHAEVEASIGNVANIFNTPEKITITRRKDRDHPHKVYAYDELVDFLLTMLPEVSNANDNNNCHNEKFYNYILLLVLKNLNMSKIRREDADTLKWLCNYYLRITHEKPIRELPFYVEAIKEPRLWISALLQHLSVLTTTLSARPPHIEQSPINQLFNAGILTLSSTENAESKLRDAANQRNESGEPNKTYYMFRLSNSQPSFCVISRKANNAVIQHTIFRKSTFNKPDRASVAAFTCDFIKQKPNGQQQNIPITFLCYESIAQLQDAIKSIWNKATTADALGTNVVNINDELLKEETPQAAYVTGYLETMVDSTNNADNTVPQQQPAGNAISIQAPGLYARFFVLPEQNHNQQSTAQQQHNPENLRLSN